MSAQQNPTSSAATSTGVLDIKITFRREGITTQSILDKIVAALGPDFAVSMASAPPALGSPPASQDDNLSARKRNHDEDDDEEEASATHQHKRARLEVRPVTIKTEANNDDDDAASTTSTTTITATDDDDKFAGFPPTMEEAIAEFVDGCPDKATGPSAAYLATETTEEERERREWNEFVAMGRVGFESWHWSWYGCGPREELEAEEVLELAYRTGCVPEVYTV
jgi:hypothetical protein